MKQWADYIVDRLFRGVVGLVVIYILQQVCIYTEFPVLAGVNPGSFFLIALLGIPGFLLVSAVGLIGIL